MVAAFVQSTTASESANATPLTTSAITTTSTNLLVAGISYDSGTLNTITGITDSKGNTWLKAIELDAAALLSLWYCAGITGGSGHTLTIAYNDGVGSAISCVLQEFSGVATSSPLDKTISAQGTSAAPSSGATATTTQADELVIGLVGWAGATSTASLGSGYTNLAQVALADASTAMESKIVAATGAQTAAMTLGASRDWAAICATFKAAAGGGGSVASRTGLMAFF